MKTPIRRCLASVATLALAACTPVTTTTTKPGPAPAPAPEPRRDNNTTAHAIGIPPGHLPHNGKCRVWIPETPPGHQAHERNCAGIVSTARPGSWIIYRDTYGSLHVHVMDPSHAGVIYLVRYYDREGKWLRDESGSRHHDDPVEGSDSHGNGRRPSN